MRYNFYYVLIISDTDNIFHLGNKCQEHFKSYKACIKNEHDSIIEERRKRGATFF